MSIYQVVDKHVIKLSKAVIAPQQNVFFPNLDGLRFIAFFLVFLSHTLKGVFAPVDEDGIVVNALVNGFFKSGDVGVSFFFVHAANVFISNQQIEIDKKQNIEGCFILLGLNNDLAFLDSRFTLY